MSGDEAMRAYAATLPAPTFDDPAFTPLSKPLSQARVAIVTSAALHRIDDDGFTQGDTSTACRSPTVTWCSVTGVPTSTGRLPIDLNVVFPIDRLEELADAGVIGAVAPRHTPSPATSPTPCANSPRLGSACAANWRDSVDVVVLTPV